MAKIKKQLSKNLENERCSPGLPRNINITSNFGELMYIHRTRQRLNQKMVAVAAGLSESYFSELENSKRIAPPRNTALRIARALNLTGLVESQFSETAEYERAGLRHDMHLPPNIRELIAMLRVAGPHLPNEILDSLKKELQEVCL